MTHSYNVITDIAKKEELCMRMAAYKHSVENIYKTTKLSGSMFWFTLMSLISFRIIHNLIFLNFEFFKFALNNQNN